MGLNGMVVVVVVAVVVAIVIIVVLGFLVTAVATADDTTREFKKGYLGSRGTWPLKNVPPFYKFSPWSYPDAAAGAAAAAASG